MALIVEDGSIVPGAESYATVAQFHSYFALRGTDVTALSDAQVEQLLRQSTDYMQGYYGLAWKGNRMGPIQVLDWPRYNVTLPDLPGGYGSYPYIVPPFTVPLRVVNACIVLAWIANSGALAPDLERQTKREKVDVIEVEYVDGAAPYTLYRMADLLVSIYLRSSDGAGVSLVRA
jgi:hypothetical protein